MDQGLSSAILHDLARLLQFSTTLICPRSVSALSSTTSMPRPASPVSLCCYSCNTSDFALSQCTAEHTETAKTNRLRARLDRWHDPMGSLPPQPRT
jgi:hypothetical protein